MVYIRSLLPSIDRVADWDPVNMAETLNVTDGGMATHHVLTLLSRCTPTRGVHYQFRHAP